VQYFFPWVQHIVIVDEDKSNSSLFVPYSALPELAGDRITWLAEKQALIAPCSKTDWPALLQRARDFKTPQTKLK
jgi:hypothetical protein